MKKMISIMIVLVLVLIGCQMILVTGAQEEGAGMTQAARGSILANTLFVGPGQVYTKIQDAIDNAGSGDTIRVYAGMYNEEIVVNKKLSLIGNGTAETIIKGDGASGDVVRITADGVQVSGFRISKSGVESAFPDADAGIELDGVENVTIKDNYCTANQYGIFIYNSKNNQIKNNICSNNENGIYLYSSINNNIANCECSYNLENGIIIESSHDNTLKNNNCSNNMYGIYSVPNHKVQSITLGSQNPEKPGHAMGYSKKVGNRYDCYSEYYIYQYKSKSCEYRGWVTFDLSDVTQWGAVNVKEAQLIIHNNYIYYVKDFNFTAINTTPYNGASDIVSKAVFDESGSTPNIIAQYTNPIVSDNFKKTIVLNVNNGGIATINDRIKGSSTYQIFAVGIYVSSLQENYTYGNSRWCDIRLRVRFEYTNELQPTTGGKGVAVGDDWSGHIYNYSSSYTDRHYGYMYVHKNITFDHRGYCHWEMGRISKLFPIHKLSWIKITQVSLRFNYVLGNGSDIYITHMKYNVTNVSLSDNNLFKDCGDGKIYYGPGITNGKYKEYEWKLDCIDEFQSALENNTFFDLGFYSKSTENYTYLYGPKLVIEWDIKPGYNKTDNKINYQNNMNVIKDNTCNLNKLDGIFLLSSTNNTISKNTCIYNYRSGIYLLNSNHNIIEINILLNNNMIGINICLSNNNILYFNDFINNKVQAYDDSSNKWNLSYPKGGNYWSDWVSPDMYSGAGQDVLGSDGIVDKPYNISGPANAKDFFPLTSGKNYNDSYNRAPVANAGIDQKVIVNQTVAFDGSKSYDPENDPITYKWDFGDGRSTDWKNSNKASHKYTITGNFTVILTVSDGKLTDNDTCIIQVSKLKLTKPSINSSFPTEIKLDEDFGNYSIKLTEYESHSNKEYYGDKLKWYVTGNSGLIFNIKGDNSTGTNADKFTFTSKLDQYGTEKLTYHLHDPLGQETTIGQTVIVAPVNDRPIAKAGPDMNVKTNTTVNFNGSKSFDIDGDSLTYKWNFGDGTLSNWSSSSLTSHIYMVMGNYTVTLTVSDGALNDTDTCYVLAIAIDPGSPMILSTFPRELVLDEDFGEFEQRLTVHEYHPNPVITNDELKWYVTGNSGSIFYMTGDNSTGDNADTFKLTSIKDQFGVEKVTYHLYDSLDKEVQIVQTIKINPVNDPPVINELPGQAIKENEAWILDLKDYISDVDNEIYELRISTNDQGNITINGTNLTFKFKNKGEYTITVQVSDGEYTDQSDISITVTGDGVEDESDLEDAMDIFQILVIVFIIILILILLIGRLLVIRKRPKTEFKPTPEDELYGKTLNEIIYNNKDSELDNQELQELLDQRMQNGEISQETYQDMKKFIENQDNSR